MAAKRPRKTKGAGTVECCGRACDERCWESSVRDTQFARRLYAVGMRVS